MMPDSLSVYERLEAVALQDFSKEDEARWNLIVEIQEKGDSTGFERASRWCDDTRPLIRCLGADVLGQFGVAGDSALHRQIVERLESLLSDPNTDVIACALVALGHRDAGDVSAICALHQHDSDEVRHGVAFALANRREEEAIQAMRVLGGDPKGPVCDLANFSLGVNTESDSPEIRAALALRLEDEGVETRLGAIMGLARRKDLKVVPHLVRELSQKQVWGPTVEAAAYFPRAEFVTPLRKLHQNNPKVKEVRAALDLCESADGE